MPVDTPPAAVMEIPGLRARQAGAAGARLRAAMPYFLTSLLVLVPCFWQSRIQAGDLSSHVYNAWLALLIDDHKVEGLVLHPQWTNFIFDRMLASLMRVAGPDWAQRLAASAAVMLFFWGAFACVRVIGRQRPWAMVPVLLALSYGTVFRCGFFNFYIGAGLALWAIAAALRPGAGAVVAAGLCLVSAVAHGVAGVWAAGVVGYILLARRIRPRHCAFLVVAWVFALWAVREYVMRHFEYRWSISQLAFASGADQLWVFGKAFLAPAAALLFWWLSLLARALVLKGPLRLALDWRVQIIVLTAATFVFLPNTILLPGHNVALEFIAERMSLFVAVLVCALLVRSRPKRWDVALATVVSIGFFGMVHHEERKWNSVEDSVTEQVAKLPERGRVVTAMCSPDTRVEAALHIVDRACVSRCFSYGNYEPSSLAFTVRAVSRSRAILHRRGDVFALEHGTYIVKPEDLPMYEVGWDGKGAVAARRLQAGDIAGRRCASGSRE